MTAPLLVLSPFRGHVRPALLDALEARGWAVHRIGRAAYVHGPNLHLVLGAWPDGESAPAWADRLGVVSPAWDRRYARMRAAQAWRRMQRGRRGRFAVRRPWFLWPAVQVYSWQPTSTVFMQGAQ